jgi:integrase
MEYSDKLAWLVELEQLIKYMYRLIPISRKSKTPQYVFPVLGLSKDPRSWIIHRHHLDQSAINRAIKQAVRQTEITKKVSTHTFRHSFTKHLLQRGTDIHTIHTLLGHKDLETTMIYTHVLKQGVQGVVSPLEDLWLVAISRKNVGCFSWLCTGSIKNFFIILWFLD